MRNVRELVGLLTQARVQMMAAQVVINAAADILEASSVSEDESQATFSEIQAMRLDVQKLDRCMGVVEDVRERYSRPNDPPKGDDQS